MAPRIGSRFPASKIILSTWCFENENNNNPDGEWDGLTKAVNEDKSWLDYIMADGHDNYFPRFLLDHEVPGRLGLLNYPGSTQLGLGMKLLERYPWSRFEVPPEWAEGDCFAAGIPGEVRFIYQAKRNICNWKGAIVKHLEPGVRYSAFYFDPASGRRFDQGTVEAPSGEYKAPRLPSPQDWVLVLEAMPQRRPQQSQ